MGALHWKSRRVFSVGLIALTLIRLQQERIIVSSVMPNNKIMPAIQKHQEIVVDNRLFNYTAYWEHGMEAALQNLKIHAPEPPESCPKVYVYDLPSQLKDKSQDKEWAFGKKIRLEGLDNRFKGMVHNTNQYAFPSILEERFKRSKYCRTKDPNEADLFYVPVLSAPKGGQEWKDACESVTGHEIVNALPHLNATNACRHFFAFGKGHYNAFFCPEWFFRPIDKLIPFQRLAYSHFSFDKHLDGTHIYAANDTINIDYPNLHSVPYPSSLHFKRFKHLMPHFAYVQERKSLMLFIGKDDHGDTLVRKQIAKLCKQYDDKKECWYIKKWMTKYVTYKSKAVFCLEPAGDSPWRKSLSDSITFGCIPVLFSELTDDVAPWFWQDWKARGRVLVPRDEFVAGRIDLKMLLQSMPSELLELMQTTLREKSRRFQYSIDDDQHDAVRIILDNLHREAIDMERRDVCGYSSR